MHSSYGVTEYVPDGHVTFGTFTSGQISPSTHKVQVPSPESENEPAAQSPLIAEVEQYLPEQVIWAFEKKYLLDIFYNTFPPQVSNNQKHMAH